MFVRYLRQFPKFNKEGQLIGRGEPIGCLVAIDKNHIGYSFCCPKDTFDREHARSLAAVRAILGDNVEVPHRIVDHYYDVDKGTVVNITLSEVLNKNLVEIQEKINRYEQTVAQTN